MGTLSKSRSRLEKLRSHQTKSPIYISSVFDPSELLNPITVRGKMYISKLWKLKATWEEDLNEDLITKFKSLVKDFSALDIGSKECMLEGRSRDSPYIL